VGARIAQRLADSSPTLLQQLGGLEADVVSAAGLAHDLGHPPFGHIAEEELNRCLLKAKERDGFEGNAQSFRIVTKLEVRETGGDDHPKFGAYRSELKQFRFARNGARGRRPCLEAQIMDWADDITYAVHDLEDFYRSGMIPLDRLAYSERAVEDFLERMFDRKGNKIPRTEHSEYRNAAHRLFEFSPVSEPYNGSRGQKAALRQLATRMIRVAVNGTSIDKKGLSVKTRIRRDITILKELTWQFVILDPRMAAEQEGKRKVIRCLFEILGNAASSRRAWKIFPRPFQEQLQYKEGSPARITSDFIASLGEQRAVELYSDMSGFSLKPIVTGLPL
jgi:dGTPase